MAPICEHKAHHDLFDHYVERPHHRKGTSLSCEGRLADAGQVHIGKNEECICSARMALPLRYIFLLHFRLRHSVTSCVQLSAVFYLLR